MCVARQLKGLICEGGNTMTTDTLNFPVFHSEQGIDTDDVVFLDNAIAAVNLAAAKDFDLTQRAAEGDMVAFEEIYKRHHRRVYSICLRMLQSPSEAEDLTQDVFIQLYRKIGSFRGDSAFSTWLHRLTVNQVLMHFRRRSVKNERTSEDGEMPEQIVRGSADPNKMQVVDRIALKNAIGELPNGYRRVFVLHDIQGFEHEEVARRMGISVGTSKSQLHKARLKLRGLLMMRQD